MFGLMQQRMFTLEQRTSATPRIDDMDRRVFELGESLKSLRMLVDSMSENLQRTLVVIDQIKRDLYAKEAADAVEEFDRIESQVEKSDVSLISEDNK